MEKTITSSKTYRYEILPCKNESKKVLYVLHGYGQLAKYFIRKFDVLSDKYHIVAPEGMHRFYLEGSAGRVGASWMTKEARDHDISDNLNWLSELDQIISKDFTISERHLLGFSQGGATAARWYSAHRNRFNSLVLWACVFPPDLNLEEEISNFQDTENSYFVIGDQDQYYNTESQETLVKFYENLNFKSVRFNGDHNINSDVIRAIYESNV